MILLEIKIGRRKRRPDAREIGRAVAILQEVEAFQIHADRDGCLVHLVKASVGRRIAQPVIPKRLLNDAGWVHRHIEAPGARKAARMLDEAGA